MRRVMAYLWQREFARNLSRQPKVTVTARELRREIARLPHGAMPGQDAATRFNLTLARSLHAAVILLEREGGMPSTQAVHTAGAAFGASGTWLARDPFAGVMKRGPSKMARAMWGEGMSVDDRHGGDTVSLCVSACPFHAYFWNVGRSDLTPILCAWDSDWQAEVNASAKPIRVEIRATIARSAKMCEFAFRKTDKAKAD